MKKNFKINLYDLCIISLVFIYGIQQIYVVNHIPHINKVFDIIEWLFYLCLVYLVIQKKLYTFNEILTIAIVSGIFLTVYIQSGYAALLKATLLIIALKGYNFKHIVKLIKNTYFAVLVGAFTLFLTGISNSGIQRRGYYAFGFSNVNVCGGIIFIICLLWLLEKDDFSKKQSLKIIAIALCVLLFTDNRTVVILLIALPVIINLCKASIKRKSKIFRMCVYTCPIICFLICIITLKLYPTSIFVQKLNPIVSSRIYLNYYNFNRYGFSLFGQNIWFNTGEAIYNEVTGGYSTFNTVDNTYICLLIQMGMCSVGVLLCAYLSLIKKTFLRKKFILIAVIIVLCLYGLFESSMLVIYMNFPFLYLLSQGDS